MDTKEIKLSDDTILTPANPLISKEDIQEFSKMISSPECQNHMFNQTQKQLYDSLGFSSPNPPKNLMVEEQSKTNKLIELSNKQISDLQNQLKNSETQLKQANDKIHSQTLVIEQLKADLDEEKEKASKISYKDWKGWIFGAIIGTLATEIVGIIIDKLQL